MSPQVRPPQGSTPPGIDLDSTDELPVLDPKAYEAASDRLAETWIQPGLKLAEAPAEVRAAAAATEDPLHIAAANLREAQALLATRGARLAEVERALEEAHAGYADAERRIEQLHGELAQARAVTERREAQHATDLAQAQSLAAQREAELGEELARARAALGQQAGDQAGELAAAHGAAERSEAQHARLLSEERAGGEQRLLQLQSELQEIRARATSYFESLQSVERRRSLFEQLLAGLHDEIDAHEAVRARLALDLAGRDTRAGELEADLEQRGARIAELESQLSTLGAALRQRDVELARLQHVEGGLAAALEAERAATAMVSTRAGEHEARLHAAHSRGATLEAELATHRKGSAEHEQELTKVRGEMEEWAGALRTAHVERSGHLASISAGEARVKELEEEVEAQAEALRPLKTAAQVAVSRTQELEADLRVAEEHITRLESLLRSRDARVSELETATQQGRQKKEESRAALADTDVRPALRDMVQTEAGEVALRDPAPDGATRLLIRSDGEREVMHVLGRKTGIGRTPDNDLQIDAKFISRHHAVILAGPAHTIIEDLNSTNGVLVNGRRITRQILNDGDQVTLGRAEYRFAVRRTEKR